MIGKVTALIVRTGPAGAELLLFQHPHAGIQIPAGTIEPGEQPEMAVVREAVEETGLTTFTAVTPLGYRDEVLPPDERIITTHTPLYTRPTVEHTYGLQLRSGITVHLERESAGMVQVSYREWDTAAVPPYPSYCLTGWVPEAALTSRRRRHFFLLRYDAPTPQCWVVAMDDHRCTLFWAPLTALPAIVAPQASWPAMLPAALTEGEPFDTR